MDREQKGEILQSDPSVGYRLVPPGEWPLQSGPHWHFVVCPAKRIAASGSIVSRYSPRYVIVAQVERVLFAARCKRLSIGRECRRWQGSEARSANDALLSGASSPVGAPDGVFGTHGSKTTFACNGHRFVNRLEPMHLQPRSGGPPMGLGTSDQSTSWSEK